ncbi:hypothetical protein [Streptomyces sp. OspMP-M43]|uniref:hypothetical protein n=1 Tax=Streptomyces sp. OspMP-M43 TaxID=1839781 RepID=UPI00159F0CAD|nr:hypothetical protein [Streptomyces sp. OspMP-M43]
MRRLLPELVEAAQHAVQAATTCGTSTAELQEARKRALQAADNLIAAAGARLAG